MPAAFAVSSAISRHAWRKHHEFRIPSQPTAARRRPVVHGDRRSRHGAGGGRCGTAGDEPALAELQERFSAWQDELAIVLNCHRIMELAPAGPRFPALGEVLGEFRLLAELGRGGMGRVYLAEQTFLAGRLMILKLTACANQEHLKLARLQHTNIVPLYSVRDFPERHLRKLCMPCLGGATLLQLLQTLRPIPTQSRTGRDVLEA